MNVIKGGWVGQTFALAKLNDSGGGRKTRVRRSKDERKTMVESFIKKYQKLNNGSFPAVSLTHKEVGGSFYTVREIVREIIQENRVLGPAKLTGNDTDNFAQQYPLGSISVEPQIDVELSNETHTATHGEPNQYQDISEELNIDSSGEYDELHHHTVGGGNIFNRTTEEIHRKEESATNIDAEICLEGEKDVEKKEAEDLVLEAHNKRLENGTIFNGHTVETERKELEESIAKVTQPNIDAEICLEGEKDVEKKEAEDLFLEAHNKRLENGTIYNGHTVETERKELEESIAKVTQPNIDAEICLEGEKDIEKKEAEDLVLEAHNKRLENGTISNGHTVETERKELEESIAEVTQTNIDAEISLDGEKDVEQKETEDLSLEARNQRLENGTIVNGHTVETERKEIEESMAKETQMKTEIFIETFPLRPALKTVEKETDKIGLDAGSVLMDEKVEANIADSLSENVLVDDKSDTSFEFLNSSTAKESLHVDVSHGIDLDSKADVPGENQSMNAPTGICTENLNGTITRDSHGPSISKTIEENMKNDIQLHQEPKKIHDPTLDRINLESWEATSKKSGRADINPLFQFIKALIVAFVKFWSE